VIIVEGMDNSGKTTLVNYLAETFNLPVIHSPGPKADLNYFMVEAMMTELKNEQVIYDRFPAFSERVYGPILRGRDHIQERYLVLLAALKPYIIHCDPGLHTVLSTIKDREQMEGVEDQAERLYHRYEKIMFPEGNKLFSFHVTRYNWHHEMSYSYIKHNVAHYLQTRKDNPW
jgi:thymidylate kinase